MAFQHSVASSTSSSNSLLDSIQHKLTRLDRSSDTQTQKRKVIKIFFGTLIKKTENKKQQEQMASASQNQENTTSINMEELLNTAQDQKEEISVLKESLSEMKELKEMFAALKAQQNQQEQEPRNIPLPQTPQPQGLRFTQSTPYTTMRSSQFGTTFRGIPSMEETPVASPENTFFQTRTEI